ncbi:MAG: hypothetical protein WBM83_12770, partial [Flavobacteriaceae bacterium]
DSNQRPSGYEPDELPTALPRDMGFISLVLQLRNIKSDEIIENVTCVNGRQRYNCLFIISKLVLRIFLES